MHNFSRPIQNPGPSSGAGNPDRREDSWRPLLIDLQGVYQEKGPASMTKCCIYRVPWRLRKINEAAYTPFAISFGPIHHGKPELQFIEKHKERYLNHFLHHTKLSLQDLVKNVSDWVSSVRQSYAETIDLRDTELMKMVLIDGCFIIEYFLRHYNNSWNMDVNDMALYKPWLDNYIVRDLILLENQLPFSVLRQLYELKFLNRQNDQPCSFFQLVSHFFFYLNKQKITILPEMNVLHFTDLVRRFHLPSSPRAEPTLESDDRKVFSSSATMLRAAGGRDERKQFSSSAKMHPAAGGRDKRKQFSSSATMLHAAGVRFIKPTSSSNCQFDITFTPWNGELQVPHIVIEDGTESLIRNLMAFEQCHYPSETMMCDYVLLMDTLINTAEDVELLVRKEVLTNSLGAHDVVATLFNNLGLEILHYHEKSYFCKLADDLAEYRKKPWNSWKASLRREYLNTPWRIASIVAATILLVLTAMQTINSFIALKHPNSS